MNSEAVRIAEKAILLSERFNNSDGYLFTDTSGKRRSSRSIASKFQRVCKELKITAYSPHDIRRTVATEIYLNTKNISIVQNLLGHSTKTQSYAYIQDVLPNEDIANALETLCS